MLIRCIHADPYPIPVSEAKPACASREL